MSIQANELRCGNILQYYIGEDGVEWDYTKIDAQDILWCQEKNENFNKVHRAIELSPEILEKCPDFGKDENYYFFQPEFENIHYRVRFTEMGIIFSQGFGDRWNNELRGIQYLHELQNGIFFFTGTELNYTP